MALPAGRVGVAKDQVDEFGHITGGSTPENVYTKSQCDNKFELKSHIGGLKFRDNNGTAQYQLPNGEWTNFSSGGGLPTIDLSELSPSTTGRSTIVVTARPDLIDEIVLYSDASRTVEIGRCSFEKACAVLNVPELVDVYWKVFKNGTAVGTSNTNSGNLKAYNDSTNHKFVANNNTVDNGHFGVVLIG